MSVKAASGISRPFLTRMPERRIRRLVVTTRLVDTQRTDGSWDEPWFTGTGFPWDFNINYHLYRLVFPVMALGRYVRNRDPAEEP